ncbi:hypothetical protein SAY87_005759 [Trapa incisa]|uniref:Uncharacterized protein n=1 Tax=Trapa incisa TaxID=236973 RepID=A0AAN7KAT1_9MYRT|nr:hypothetical protein SAY87_005759 [Trapa incisa]
MAAPSRPFGSALFLILLLVIFSAGNNGGAVEVEGEDLYVPLCLGGIPCEDQGGFDHCFCCLPESRHQRCFITMKECEKVCPPYTGRHHGRRIPVLPKSPRAPEAASTQP